MAVKGIDVSHHQGTIDWNTVKAELLRINGNTNPGFAILRIGYSSTHGRGGLVMDNQFLRNLAECERLGIPVGVYWYCYDRSAEAARITAQQVVKMLAGHKYQYPIYYDVEYEAFNRAAGKAVNTSLIVAALDVLEKAGYYAAVYCSRNFFLQYTNLSQLSGFDKWEAAYTATDTNDVQNGLWQCSSSNAWGIKGFGNKLDCDLSYKDYPTIIQNAGLNGYAKPGTEDAVWASNGPWIIEQATGQDKKALRELCESKQLKVATA